MLPVLAPIIPAHLDRAALTERFWRQVRKSGDDSCWWWRLTEAENRYGSVNIAGRSMNAQRYAYALLVGNFDPSLFVLHRCDNPACVRVDPADLSWPATHLYLGTQVDNMRDKVERGRTGLGQRPLSDYLRARVNGILETHRGGLNRLRLAAELGTNRSNITRFLDGEIGAGNKLRASLLDYFKLTAQEAEAARLDWEESGRPALNLRKAEPVRVRCFIPAGTSCAAPLAVITAHAARCALPTPSTSEVA